MINLKGKRLSDEELEAAVLHKFNIKGAWGEYHIYDSDVPKGFPSHLRGDVAKAAERLKRKGMLMCWPHGRENVWILNKKRSAEIIGILKRFYQEIYN